MSVLASKLNLAWENYAREQQEAQFNEQAENAPLFDHPTLAAKETFRTVSKQQSLADDKISVDVCFHY